jgi:O-antigen ligase
MASPILGYGLGSTFTFYFASWETLITTRFSHCSYLYYLLNFGIIGTVIIFITFFTIFGKCFFLIRNIESAYLRSLVKGLQTALFGVLASSLTTANISSQSGYFFLGTCLGIFTALYRISKEKHLAEEMKNE